ncbi:hypothetical protein [Corynebacterium coyleae]|uniref:hypothetical protein n=1 Tax=Corynebacterium coyleae TaxID=53374 RepID=UPI00254E276C|nr:hypothetical protein [Corynebacterium coyleae]MDK8242536.1 hypothetical protein [Corynebacterium coyleae]
MMTPEQARDMLHYESEDGFTAPELCLTAELAARAPGMAEQIANMRYEYAVQVIEDGRTEYVTKYKSLTSAPWGAAWLPTFNSADVLRRECVIELCLQERRAETFVVRKLASEPEVMEPEVVE